MKIYLCGAITYYWENKELYKAMDWRIRLRKKLEELNKTIGKNNLNVLILLITIRIILNFHPCRCVTK